MSMNLTAQHSPFLTVAPALNRLLSQPHGSDGSNIFESLSLVNLTKEEVLYRPNSQLNYAYFPINSIIAILNETEDGASTVISIIGNEGMADVSMILGAERTSNYAVVQSPGYAYRIRRNDLLEGLEQNIELRTLLLRYAQSFMSQIAQNAVCNCHHCVDQRLCRLLLQSLDRLDGNRLTLTQELVARLLGARRESITVAAGKLKTLGVISYHRGNIEVLDRDKLELLCCECYDVVKNEQDHVFTNFKSAMTGSYN